MFELSNFSPKVGRFENWGFLLGASEAPLDFQEPEPVAKNEARSDTDVVSALKRNRSNNHGYYDV